MNYLTDCDSKVLALADNFELKRRKASHIDINGIFHFNKKVFSSVRRSLDRGQLLAMASCFTRTQDIRVSERIASVLVGIRSKSVTKFLLTEYSHCTVAKKQLIIYVLSNLSDNRCRRFFENEWTNQELDRFARCNSYEALALLYARKKKTSLLIELISNGLQQEPHLQLAALAKSCHLTEATFPDHLVSRMAAIPVIVSEVCQAEDNWLYSRIRNRIQSDNASA